MKENLIKLGKQAKKAFDAPVTTKIKDKVLENTTIPIDKASRKLTAFRTAKGLFEWLRLPMGLKDAGSYFQMQMTKIFEDLLYNILDIRNLPR